MHIYTETHSYTEVNRIYKSAEQLKEWITSAMKYYIWEGRKGHNMRYKQGYSLTLKYLMKCVCQLQYVTLFCPPVIILPGA
jgi:hypothetical protein